jgi:hypothetical protein
MDEHDVREIEARADAAALGPWTSWIERRDHAAGSNFIETRTAEGRGSDIELLGASTADQDFIAAARSDVPDLIAEIHRLKELVETQARFSRLDFDTTHRNLETGSSPWQAGAI